MSSAPDRGDGGQRPFRLAESFDVPELLGASWWQASMQATAGPARRVVRGAADDGTSTRRQAMLRLLGIGMVVVGAPIAIGMLRGRNRAAPLVGSVDLQRQRGWNVDGGDAKLVFADAQATDVDGEPVAAAAKRALAASLQPTQPRLQPHARATLFQALAASDELLRQTPPICSDAMRRAFGIGQEVAALFGDAAAPTQVALVVDLPGPESVAFAAGAAAVFAPVFTFDNWPHPKGVVPAHRTLAAALYYAPRLRAPNGDARARALFALDRDRLAAYHNEPDRFDNRYLAALPNGAQLRALNVQRVLHVVPSGVTQELDDLNDEFADWSAGKLEVRLLALDQFSPGAAAPVGAAEPQRYHYFGSSFGRSWFWHHYAWSAARPAAPQPPPAAPRGAAYQPLVRDTMFSRPGQTGIGLVRDRSAPSRSSGGSWSRSRPFGFG